MGLHVRNPCFSMSCNYVPNAHPFYEWRRENESTVQRTETFRFAGTVRPPFAELKGKGSEIEASDNGFDNRVSVLQKLD
jgi:hypothetical protein